MTNSEIIADYFKHELIASISSVINEKVLTTKFISSDRSNLRKWTTEGIIEDNRENKLDKKRYNIPDIIWIGIVESLRQFGYSLEKIKKVKELVLVSDQGLGVKYPYLEYFLIQAAFFKVPYYLVAHQTGNAEFLHYENYCKVLQMNDSSGHILLSLNQIYADLVLKIDNSKWNFSDLFEHSKEELELLAFIKKGNFTEVKVIMPNGVIERLEGTERISTQKRIIDILNDAKYQDIQVKQQDGKPICINRTVKKKIKSK